MNNTTISPETVAVETAYFFQIMNEVAKAAGKRRPLRYLVNDLEAIAMHSQVPAIAERAAYEAQRITDALARPAARSPRCAVLPFVRPTATAPLN